MTTRDLATLARAVLLIAGLAWLAPVQARPHHPARRPAVAAVRPKVKPKTAVVAVAAEHPQPRTFVPAPAEPPVPSPEEEAVDAPPAAHAPSAPPAAAGHAATSEELLHLLKTAPGKVTVVGLVVDLASGKVVLDLDSSKPVYPASVAKMFSTAAILRAWPADKLLTTEVRASAPVQGGVETLAIVGGGDPSLRTADLAKLADAVKQKGITHVGKLVIDSTLFDDKLPRGFDEKQTDAAFRAPVGGLQVDTSVLWAAVRPGAVGEPPLVDVTPACGEAAVVRNEAKTVKGGKDALTMLTRPAGRQTELVVQGTISTTHKVIGSGPRRVADAAVFAGGVFRALLEKRGIAVKGETLFGKAPRDLPLLASHDSQQLLKLVQYTNKHSHNGNAETLYKLNAVAKATVPATAEKAEAAVRKSLSDLEIRWQGVQLGNGSGLYHADKVTCQAVVDLVRGMAKDAAGVNWRGTLAIGGVDGTLRGRLGGMRGKVQAKTGTLDDVVGLAGYAEGSHGTYAFAMFFNGVRGGPGAYRALHDRVLTRLLAD